MTKAKIQPNYYAVIPASVRYDNELPPLARLLYAEISALSNQSGFCWASNKYFGDLFGVAPKSVSRLIAQLEEAGHIVVDVDSQGGNARNIYLAEAIHLNEETLYTKKRIGIHKNVEHNNKTNNKENTNSAEVEDSHDSKDIAEAYRLYLRCFKAPSLLEDTQLPITKELIEEAIDKASRRYKLTDKRRAAIKRRLEDAGLNMLKAAIIGYSRSDWHTGQNDRGWIADLEEFICRSYENVEKGANLFESQKQAKKTNDPWQ